MNGVSKSRLDFFKYFDAFGAKAYFNIEGSEDSRSSLGGCIYFIFMILSTWYIFVNFLDLINRNNVNLIYSHKIVNQSPLIDLKQGDFSLGVGISDDNYILTDDFFTENLNVEYKLIKILNKTKT